jgi:hypothetical protein
VHQEPKAQFILFRVIHFAFPYVHLKFEYHKIFDFFVQELFLILEYQECLGQRLLLLLRREIGEDVAGLNLALVLRQLAYAVHFPSDVIVITRGEVDAAKGQFGSGVVQIQEFKLDSQGFTLLMGVITVNRDFWNYISQ